MPNLPIIISCLAGIAAILLSIEIGFRLGKYAKNRNKERKHDQDSTLISATLALLAFLLAYTFGIAEAKFVTVRDIDIEEANNIGTTYLRADFFPEPQRSQIQNMLKRYVDIRASGIRKFMLDDKLMEESSKIQSDIWNIAASEMKKNPDSMAIGLFIQSLNNVIDTHGKRVVITLHRYIPVTVWIMLITVSICSMMGIGYQSGLSGKRSVMSTLMMVSSFAVVMLIIGDLDRPHRGLLKTGQWAMISLQKQINKNQ